MYRGAAPPDKILNELLIATRETVCVHFTYCHPCLVETSMKTIHVLEKQASPVFPASPPQGHSDEAIY